MPEVIVHFTWPDGKPDSVYSPSTVIRRYFTPGETLALDSFQSKVNDSLKEAGRRVKEKFGFECTSALAETERLNGLISSGMKKGSVAIGAIENAPAH